MPLNINTNLSDYFQKNNLGVDNTKSEGNPSNSYETAMVDSSKTYTPIEHKIPYEVDTEQLEQVNHKIPSEVDTEQLEQVNHKIPGEVDTASTAGLNNLTSDFQKALSNLSSRQLEDNSELNIGTTPQIIDFLVNQNSSGFTPFQTETQFKVDTSDLGPNNSSTDYFANINAIGFTRNMTTSLYDPLSSNLGPNDGSTNFIEDRNAPGFTRFMLETLYDVNSSELGPNNETANWITDINATGFTRNAIPLQTLYDVNSSRLGPNDGSVNYFTDRNAIGFTRNAPLLVTLYNVNSSTLGPNNESANWIIDANARGFTRGFNGPPTLYDVNSSELGPNNESANWFSNINATGFTRNPLPLVTEYRVDSSAYGPNEGSVNYISNIHGEGFIRNMATTLLKPDTSILGPNDGSTNYFANINSEGFTRNMVNTLLKAETTNLGPNDGAANFITDLYGGGFVRNVSDTALDYKKSNLSIINDKQEINFIIDNIAQGFNAQVLIGDTKLDAKKSNLRKENEQNYFVDTNNDGFIRKFESTTLKPDTTQLAWGGGSIEAPTTPGFIKFFNDSVLEKLDTNLNIDETPQDYVDIAKSSDLGPLGIYAITRRSPSPLDEQYQKFNLRRDSFNPDFIKQPYILRGIQNGLEPERWGGYAEVDGLSDLSPFGFLEYKLAHLERQSKFQISGRGLLNILRQTGLQRMNPAVETEEGLLGTLLGRPTWIYNPLSTVRGGVRHGLSLLGRPQDAPGRYEDVVKFKHENTKENTKGSFTGTGNNVNRLVTLYDELFEAPITSPPISAKLFDGVGQFGALERLANRATEFLAETAFPNIFNNDRIKTLSVLNGGPDSLMGIGPTTITRKVDSRGGIPGKVYYTDTSQYASKVNTGITKTNDTVNANRLIKDDEIYGSAVSVNSNGILNQYLSQLSAGSKTAVDDTVKANRLIKDDEKYGSVESVNSDGILNQYSSQLNAGSKTAVDDTVKADRLIKDDEKYGSVESVNSDGILNQYLYQLSAGSKTAGDDTNQHSVFLNGAPRVPSDKFDGEPFSPKLSTTYSELENEQSKFKDSDANPKHKSTDESSLENPLKRYTTLAYGQLPTQIDRVKSSGFNDFRTDLDKNESKTFSTDPDKLANKFDKNIHERKWYPDFGKPGRDKSDPYADSAQLPWEGGYPIKFIIAEIDFKAINTSMNFNQSNSWSSINMIGRADPVHMFTDFSRSGGVDFTVVVESLKELQTELDKINRLRNAVTPSYNIEILAESIKYNPEEEAKNPKYNALTNAKIIPIQIGDFYSANVAVESISVTVDDDMGWNIDAGAELPRKLKISLSFKEVISLGARRLPNGNIVYGYGGFGIGINQIK